MSKTSNRARAMLLTTLALALAAVGVVAVWQGLQPPPPAPLPTAAITADPEQKPTGPIEAETESNTTAELPRSSISIPAIDASAVIVDTTISGGSLGIPGDATKLARWNQSATLGSDTGNTLLTGHVTNGSTHGALYRLAELEAGNIAWIKDADGELQQYQLLSLEAVVKQALPDRVWETDGQRRLTVVTCGGPVTHTDQGRQYRDNVIATFLPVDIE